MINDFMSLAVVVMAGGAYNGVLLLCVLHGDDVRVAAVLMFWERCESQEASV